MATQAKILLVNDEPVQRYRVASLLRKEGFLVKEAEDGLEALNLLDEGFSPDLVITDLYMPRVDGWQLCRHLRERGLKMPILVISAFFEFKEIAEILTALGVDDYLRSPIKSTELLSKVFALLKGSTPKVKPQHPLLLLSSLEISRESLVRALRRAGFELNLAFSLEEAQKALEERAFPLALISGEYRPGDLFQLKKTSPSTSFVVLFEKEGAKDPFHYVLKGARHVVPEGSSPEFIIYLLQRELKEQALRTGQELLRHKTKELEKVSQELTRIQNVLRTVVEQATDIGIIVTDENVNPFFANPKAQEFFSASPERDFWGFLRVLFGQQSDLQEMLSSVRDKGHYYCEVRIPEREEILTFKARPLKERDRTVGFVFFIEDVTRERELQSRLREMQKMEAIATLAAGIAHDFNNLLAAIRLKAELLQDKLGNGYGSYVADIMAICDRAAQVVRQILSFSQPRKSGEVADLNQQVHEALEFLRETIPRGIRLQVELFPQKIPVGLDPGKLSQIVFNLCLNAVQAMGEQGTLLVRTGREKYTDFRPSGFMPGGGQNLSGEFGWLEVRDTGCGIRPEHLSKIFDPYFTTKQEQLGTGLGLAVTYGLVAQAGGAIAVETSPNQGTTFYIYLPVATLPELKDLLPPLIPQARPGARILLIEDEAVIREAMAEFLERKGYELFLCENGDEALRFLKDRPQPDAVILDLNLPGVPGTEVARRFKEKWQEVALLVTTGYMRPQDRETLEKLGVEKILLKPFTLDHLLESLEWVLTARHKEGLS